ncbi:MAG: GNAT family N-acetyltransferase [Candidatus Acidiferrales bacterium]
MPHVIFNLRPHNPEDFETLYEIDQLCYPPSIAYSRREMRIYLRAPGAACVIAELAGQPIGFCLTAHEDAWGYIITIDVLESHRRAGVGGMLLRDAEQRLAAQGVKEIALETGADNAPAIAFWKKHGYRICSVRKGYYPGALDAYSMRKPL